MKKTFIDSITDDDIENIGLRVFRKGRSKNCSLNYLHCGDKQRIFDDGKLICHYEILHIKKDDVSDNINHKKDKVYVEIHFENKEYSKNFKPVLKQLSNIDETLELFNWESYCPGIRIWGSVFDISQKQEILKNLSILKDKTLDILLTTYKDIIHESGWQSDFNLISKKEHLQENGIYPNL